MRLSQLFIGSACSHLLLYRGYFRSHFIESFSLYRLVYIYWYCAINRSEFNKQPKKERDGERWKKNIGRYFAKKVPYYIRVALRIWSVHVCHRIKCEREREREKARQVNWHYEWLGVCNKTKIWHMCARFWLCLLFILNSFSAVFSSGCMWNIFGELSALV